MKRLISFLILPALLFVLVSPLLVVAPQQAHAIDTEQILDVSWSGITTAIRSTISSIADVTTSIATHALWVKTWILDPIAFVQSGNALRAITAGVVDFINGGNSSGNPLYIRNLSQHVLGVGDQQAMNFFGELGQSNAPFGSSILASLRMNYLQGTSGAGFWAANQCTLGQYSANPTAFIGGDFRQGGWPAWFALSTQPQNNPYLFYYRAQAELYSRTEKTVANTLTQLAWGEGFMSWCGDQTSSGGGEVGADGIEDTVAITSAANCMKDGKPGTIQTPASVIKDSLHKVLGTDLDRLIKMGDVATIMNNVMQTLQVLAYGQQLLGGGGSGGLFGASQPSGNGATSLVQQYRNQATVSQATINGNATTYQNTSAQQAAQLGSSGASTIQNGVNPQGGSYAGFSGTTGNGNTGNQGNTGNAGFGTLPANVQYQTGWGTVRGYAQQAQAALVQVSTVCPAPYSTNADAANTATVNTILTLATTRAAIDVNTAQITSAQAADAQATALLGTVQSFSCENFTATASTLAGYLNQIKTMATNAAAACVAGTDMTIACPP